MRVARGKSCNGVGREQVSSVVGGQVNRHIYPKIVGGTIVTVAGRKIRQGTRVELITAFISLPTSGATHVQNCCFSFTPEAIPPTRLRMLVVGPASMKEAITNVPFLSIFQLL